MTYRSLICAVLTSGALAIGGGTAHADTATDTDSPRHSNVGAMDLSYAGAYPSPEECDAAGQQYLGVDYFCFEGNNDGRPVWELWLESNEPDSNEAR